MSEEPVVDIFKYSPKGEWNGLIIDFDMPSTDGDTRLTEICLAAESCLEATKNAMDLSWIDDDFTLARSSPVLKIIRTLFGEDTGIEIITFPAIEGGVAYFLSPMVLAGVSINSKNWAYEVVNNYMNIAIDLVYYDKWTGPEILGESANLTYRFYTHRETHAPNPKFTGVATTGIRPIVGNWDTDGDPWVEIQWEHISTSYCSDGVSTTQGNCLNSKTGGFCRQADFNNPLIVSLNHTASCNDSQYPTKILCENAGKTWTVYQIPYDSKEITFPAGQATYILQPLKEDYCLGIANIYGGGQGNWNNNGICLHTRFDWAGGAGDTWLAHNSITSREMCMETVLTWNGWADYFTMWIENTNTWDDIYAIWGPTHNAWGPAYGNPPTSAFIPGTVNSHKRYNILTADNHRKYGSIHASSGQDGTFAPTNFRMYSLDDNWSWGNGDEVGRSSIPMWITNTFEWANPEAAYEYCHGPGITGDNPQSQWSPPTYTDDVACLAAGDCTNNSYVNNEDHCLAKWSCSGNGAHHHPGSGWTCTDWNGYPWSACWGGTEHVACVNARYCTNSAGSCNAPAQYSQYCTNGYWNHWWYCENEGICTWYYWFMNQWFGPYGGSSSSQGSNNPGWCTSIGQQINASYPGSYSTFSHANNSWASYGYTWGSDNTWTSDGNYWTTTIPMVESVMPVEPQEQYWNLKYEAHGFVNGFNYASRPQEEFGYTSPNRPDSAQIRWKPPQWATAAEAKYYPRPSHFRIYRSPWVSPEGFALTGSDYEADIWKIAGETICNNEAIYHYFYDSRAELVKVAMGEFDRVYYRVTAVWKDWNWKRGYWVHKIGDWTGGNNGLEFTTPDWDKRYGQSWSHYNGQERLDGVCSLSQFDGNQAACLGGGGSWTAGYWTGTDYAGADLDNVETAPAVAGWPQYFFAAKRVMYNHTWAWQRKTFRYSGYFRAPVSGEFKFEIKSDDSSYLWLGGNGVSLASLVGSRNNDNFLAAVPGDHGVQFHVGRITLVKDEIYPLLVYYTNNNGPGSLDLRTHYPDGEWNDGGTGVGLGEWKYVHHYLMPGDMDPVTQGDGQTVEGWETATDIYSWYTS